MPILIRYDDIIWKHRLSETCFARNVAAFGVCIVGVFTYAGYFMCADISGKFDVLGQMPYLYLYTSVIRTVVYAHHKQVNLGYL